MRLTKEEVEKLKASADALKAVIFCPAPEKFPVLFLCTPGGKFLQAHVKAVGDTALSHFLPLPYFMF